MEGLELISEVFINEAFAPNNKAIIDMIRNRRVVSIYYMGDDENAPGWRKIEPVAYGEEKGINYIRAWQQSGKTLTANNRWKFFRVDRIRNVNFASNQTFNKPRPNYNTTGDKHLSKIYAIADFKCPLGADNDKEPDDNKPSPSKPLVPGPGQKKSTSLIQRLKTLKELFEIF